MRQPPDRGPANTYLSGEQRLDVTSKHCWGTEVFAGALAVTNFHEPATVVSRPGESISDPDRDLEQ
jgi:hypothetical protein